MAQFEGFFPWKKSDSGNDSDYDRLGGSFGEDQPLPSIDDLMMPDLFPVYPEMYQVVILSDEKTPKECVIGTLQSIFHMKIQSAEQLANDLSQLGKVTCGIFTRDVAETKIQEMVDFSQSSCFPLKCMMQKGSGDVI